MALLSTEPECLILQMSLLLPKATRSDQGVVVMTLKPKYQLQRVCTPEESGIVNLPLSGPQHPRYRRSPAAGGPGRGAADPAVRKEEPMKRNVLRTSDHHGVLRPVCRGVQLDVRPQRHQRGRLHRSGADHQLPAAGLPIGTIVIILNVPLFVLGWRFIGKDFLVFLPSTPRPSVPMYSMGRWWCIPSS